MGKVGRYFCVAIPFILTVLSIIFLLVAALSGVSNKELFMFEINLSELSIDTDSISSLIGGRDLGDDISNAISGKGGDEEEDGEKESDKGGDIMDKIGDKIGSAISGRDLGDKISDAISGDSGSDSDSDKDDKSDKGGDIMDKIGDKIGSAISGRDLGDKISDAITGDSGSDSEEKDDKSDKGGDVMDKIGDKIGSAISGRDLGDKISDAITGDSGSDSEEKDDKSDKGGDFMDKVGDKIGSAISGRDEITDKIGDVAGDALGGGDGGGGGTAITPSDLGLHDIYKVSVWGYCSEKKGGKDTECKKPKMGWADEALDTSFIEDITKALGSDFQIPEEIESALDTFKTVSKWTQIVFIIALAALAAQIIVGFFSACTRIASCLCFLIAGLSTVATIAAAALSTATSAVIVGALEGSEQMYGAKGTMNTGFLALVWIAVAFAIGAAIFWLATICCCSPDHSSRRERRKAKHADTEKGFATQSYEPLQDPNDPYAGHGHGHNGGYYGGSQASHNAPSFYEQPYTSQYPDHSRADMAYEPYSHRA